MNTETYDATFFERHQDGAVRSAEIIVPLILKLAEIDSVIDIGCGQGAWLKAFRERGVGEVRGLDGDYVDRSKLLIEPSCFTPQDLSRPFEINGRYDLAVCLEVAEHLPEKAGRELVARLVAAAPLVLFSAAIPGQGGTGHVNEQWPSYWQAIFGEHGFRRLDPVRRHVWRERGVRWWYRQNIFLYASEDALSASAGLKEELALASDDTEFELIQSSVFDRYRTLRGIIREVPRVARRRLKQRLARYFSGLRRDC